MSTGPVTWRCDYLGCRMNVSREHWLYEHLSEEDAADELDEKRLAEYHAYQLEALLGDFESNPVFPR